MFYCKECGHKYAWPDGILKSLGSCEVCGKKAICSDVPSTRLPIPINWDDQLINAVKNDS